MAETSHSVGVMMSVSGNWRSTVTPRTHGFDSSDDAIAASSTLSSVVPAGTSMSCSAVSCETCPLPFTMMLVAVKSAELMTTSATTATSASTAAAPATILPGMRGCGMRSSTPRTSATGAATTASTPEPPRAPGAFCALAPETRGDATEVSERPGVMRGAVRLRAEDAPIVEPMTAEGPAGPLAPEAGRRCAGAESGREAGREAPAAGRFLDGEGFGESERAGALAGAMAGVLGADMRRWGCAWGLAAAGLRFGVAV